MTTDVTYAQPQPTPPAPRRRRPLRRVVTTAAVCGVAIGAVTAVSWATRSDAAHDATVTEQVDMIEIDVDAGGVEVIGSDRDDIAVEWRERSTFLADAKVTHQVTGSTLSVIGTCDQTLWLTGCSTEVVVRVPADVEVVATTSAGSITAAGLDGRTELHTDAGRIRAEDQAGDLVAHSDAGTVNVDGLLADTATVTSSAGGVSVDALDPVTDLIATSDAGNVTVTVPDDGEAYNVDASTDAGSTTVDIPTDPSATRTIQATSNAGSVVVTMP